MDAFDRIIWAQTDKGTRIGTAFDHVGYLRNGRGSLASWYKVQAAAIGFAFSDKPIGHVKAEVNHGHWIVRCPWCRGAEEAAPGEPIFYCMSCGNSGNGGNVAIVDFPTDRILIEKVLLGRVAIENRNWLPSETVVDLLQENITHEVK